MNLCTACTLAVAVTDRYCTACGARVGGPIEPRWRLRWRMPDGSGNVLSTTETYDATVQQLRHFQTPEARAHWFAVPVDEAAWRRCRLNEEHGVNV